MNVSNVIGKCVERIGEDHRRQFRRALQVSSATQSLGKRKANQILAWHSDSSGEHHYSRTRVGRITIGTPSHCNRLCKE